MRPIEDLEAALQVTFGISLSEVSIPEDWGYIERENAYCSNHSDAYIIGPIIITAVTDSGGTIEIAYTVASYYNTATGEFLESADLPLTLQRQADGTVRAVSNGIA